MSMIKSSGDPGAAGQPGRPARLQLPGFADRHIVIDTMVAIPAEAGMASALLLLAAAAAAAPPPLPHPAMTQYLVELSDWIMTLDVGSNVLKGDFTPAADPTHIFINGNFARVLFATYKINGNETYLAEGLRWCDTLVSLQYRIETSKGEQGGYWDTGYKTIYIADTGTAVTNLVLGYHMSKDEGQKASFVEALGRYSRFVTGGCTTVPTLNSTTTPLGTTCPPKGKGWVHTEGANAGGLGDGYYMGGINMLPYSISTATTGSCTFSEVTSISASASWGIPFQQISQGAIKWLLDSRNSSGVIPYILHGPNGSLFPGHYIYQAITYSSESFISNALRFPDSAVAMASQLNSTVDWMIKEQNPDGTWGVLLSGDGERSPRAVSLLQWHNSIFPSSKTTAAIASFVKYLLDPQNSAAFGVKKGILQSGFVGLVFADLLQPWVTFSPP